MTNIVPYLDAIIGGGVLGIGPGSTPEQAADQLGSDYVDDARSHRLRRDYGLLELHYDRAEAGFVCFGITIQVHRLASGAPELVPLPLRGRYGAFDRFVSGAALVESVLQRLGEGEPTRERISDDFIRVRIRGTAASIHEIGNPMRVRDDQPGLGDVWSIELGRQEEQSTP